MQRTCSLEVLLWFSQNFTLHLNNLYVVLSCEQQTIISHLVSRFPYLQPNAKTHYFYTFLGINWLFYTFSNWILRKNKQDPSSFFPRKSIWRQNVSAKAKIFLRKFSHLGAFSTSRTETSEIVIQMILSMCWMNLKKFHTQTHLICIVYNFTDTHFEAPDFTLCAFGIFRDFPKMCSNFSGFP